MEGFRVLRSASARVLALGFGLCVAIGQATAATFVVTTTADSNDGACTVALCSLRDAVIASNAIAGPNIITLPAGTYTLTIAGTGENAAATGDLDITKPVTINGAGATLTLVDGGGLDRVFDVSSFGVIFNDIAIKNGAPASGENGGGIANNGTLTLNNCVVTSNHTTGGGAGGGIWTNNTLTLNNTLVNGNAADGNGGGIDNEDQVIVIASNISFNAAGPGGGKGGGIYDNGGSSSITDSTISSNTTSASGDGAGLYHNGTALPISRSTFSGNTSGRNGGGIYNNGIDVTLTNVTISGNAAASGGGFFNFGNGAHIIASTIASNTGGGITNGGVNVDATGAIIANNDTNCSGSVTDSGTNLQFPGTTCGLSIPTADPLLQALANNGGPTQTHALTAGSPAIDTNNEICPPTPPTDQRGVARPQGPHCDIGSFELAAGGGLPTLSINNVTANEGNSGTTPFVFTVTLSAASTSPVTVNYATADGTAVAPGDYAATSGTLTFAPGVTTQTITVNVVGDTTPELNETFSVNLSSPANATIATGTGTGTIINDDAAPPPPAATIIPTLSEWALILLAAMVLVIAVTRLRKRVP